MGLGRIGQTVQKMLQPFGVQKFVYTGRHKLSEDLENGAEYKSFEDLLKMSDFVIVTCALTPDTKEIFNKNAFEIMKPTSVFINTSRGGKVTSQSDNLRIFLSLRFYVKLKLTDLGYQNLQS